MANRIESLSSEMSKLIYEAIRLIKDPRCTEMTSVVNVSVTKDLKFATVVLSVFSMNESKKKATFEAIKNASGFIRHYLSKEMSIRTVPSLKFEMDEAMEYSAKINKIINSLNIKPKEEDED